jgi:hypothetical protein
MAVGAIRIQMDDSTLARIRLTLKAIADDGAQNRVLLSSISGELKKAWKRFIYPAIITAVGGGVVHVRTGTLLRGMMAQSKPQNDWKNPKRGNVRIEYGMPTRAALGISKSDKWYYPAILEYGSPTTGLAARRWLRGSVDRVIPRLERGLCQSIADLVAKKVAARLQREARMVRA